MKEGITSISEMLWIVAFGALLCYSEGYREVKYGPSRLIPSVDPFKRAYSTVVVHRETATWSEALELCRKQQSDLLCYTKAKHVSQIAAELTFFGFPKMWIRNRNCSDPISEANLSVDLKDLNFTNGNGKYVSRHKFCTESEKDKLPYVCFANVSASGAQSSMQLNETLALPQETKEGDPVFYDAKNKYFLIHDEYEWPTANKKCIEKKGILACIPKETSAEFLLQLMCVVCPKENEDCDANKKCRIQVWHGGKTCNDQQSEDQFAFMELNYIPGGEVAISTDLNDKPSAKRKALCQLLEISTSTEISSTELEIKHTTMSTRLAVTTEETNPVQTCPSVEPPASGNTSGKCDGTAIVGDICSILCWEGFEGSGTLTCREGSEWDAPTPSCKITVLTSESSSLISTTTTSGSSTAAGNLCCKGKHARGIDWEETCDPGLRQKPCPETTYNDNKMAKWYCNTLKGEWEPETPDLGDCTSSEILEIIAKINDSNVPEALGYLQEKEPKYGGDLLQVGDKLSDVLNNLQDNLDSLDPSTKKEFITNVTNDVTTLGDSLLQNKVAWSDLPEGKRVKAATKLLRDEERVAFQYAYNLEDESVKTIKKTALAMQVMKYSYGEFQSESLSLPRRTEEVRIEDSSTFVLPQDFEDSFINNGKNTFVVFVMYTDLKDILVKQSDDISGNVTSSSKVNSPVFSVSVNNVVDQTKLKTKTSFVLRHSNINADKPVCAYWNTNRLTWDTEGCEYVSHNSTFTVCACDHLTSFAILMDIHGTLDTLSDGDLHALKIITQVGCILSIIFLTAAIVVSTVYRALWSMRNSVHRNLCICLLLAEVIFISGGGSTENRILCSVIAGFLHYFFLGAFSWMFLEAVVIYLLLYKVFSPKKSYTKRFYLFGYGLPMLIVGISAASRPDGYGTSTFCWLSLDRGLRWSFVGPAALILSVNFVALVYALWIAVRTNKNVNPKTGNPVSRTWILGALTLVPLLGSTWIFGFLLLRQEPAFVYTFTILNSLQGFAIFVVQCLLNQSSRKCLVKTFAKYTHLIPVGSLSSSTLRSTVRQDTRRRSTNTANERRPEPATQPPQTNPPILNKINARQRSDSQGNKQDQVSQKTWSNFGRLFFRGFSSQSRSIDLSTASYTDSSEVCYSSSYDNSNFVVLRNAQHDQTFL